MTEEQQLKLQAFFDSELPEKDPIICGRWSPVVSSEQAGSRFPWQLFRGSYGTPERGGATPPKPIARRDGNDTSVVRYSLVTRLNSQGSTPDDRALLGLANQTARRE